MNESQIHRYARHISLGSVGMRGQKRLLAATVSVSARGDSASHCALVYLAAAGVGQLAVRDADEPIDAGEVERGIAIESSDVGSRRLDVLRRRLGALNPDVEVTAWRSTDPPPIELRETETLAEGLAAGCAAAARRIATIAGGTA